MSLKRILSTSVVRLRCDVGSYSVYLRYVFGSPWYVFRMGATSVRLRHVFGDLRCNFDASSVKGPQPFELNLDSQMMKRGRFTNEYFKTFEFDFSPSRYSSHPLMCVCAGDIRETMAQKLRHITWKWQAVRTLVLTLTPARDLKPKRKLLSYRSMTSLNFSPTLFTSRKNDLLRQYKL